MSGIARCDAPSGPQVPAAYSCSGVGDCSTGLVRKGEVPVAHRWPIRGDCAPCLARDAARGVQFVKANGERAMYESIDLRKACCGLRKLEPLSRMLAQRDAWVTGLRREQSNHRGVVGFSDTDDKGRAKINPLADWTWNDVWHHLSTNEVPYNPLHDEFMPSIGCAPCTRAIAVGEDFRAGRWWWEDEKAKECGLHVHDDAAQSLVSTIGARA